MKLTKQSVITFIRHCEKWRYHLLLVHKVLSSLHIKKRRSNLPSLIGQREPFVLFTNLPSLQTQRREIAKSLQQQVASGHSRRRDNGMIRPVEDSCGFSRAKLIYFQFDIFGGSQ